MYRQTAGGVSLNPIDQRIPMAEEKSRDERSTSVNSKILNLPNSAASNETEKQNDRCGLQTATDSSRAKPQQHGERDTDNI